MTTLQTAKPYGSARDLPSVKELEQQMKVFRLLGVLLPKKQQAELKELQREHRRIVTIVDRFYGLLGERNWIFTGDLNVDAMEGVVRTEDPNAAEALLLAYYKSDGRIEFPLGRLRHFEAMRLRMPLLEKALVDYREGRYYSVVLVLLSVMDGFVNDLEPAHRRGLHARSEQEMVAWDSVVGHHLGLSHAHASFIAGFHKTDTSEVVDLYRNGIIHGMLLNYDNEVVATKAWNMLFAVADWAESRERQVEPVESEPTLRQLLRDCGEIQKGKTKLETWEPYEYEPALSADDPSEVALNCADFLEKWKKGQWALVGAYFLQPETVRSSENKLAVEAKELFQGFALESWNLIRVRHVAAAVAHTDVVLVVNGNTYETDLRWIRMDSTGRSVCEWEDGHWELSKYGPLNYLKPEKIKIDSEMADPRV